MAARLCDVAGTYEVLMPTDAARSAPRGRHGRRRTARSSCAASPVRSTSSRLTGVPVLAPTNDTGELWTRSPFA